MAFPQVHGRPQPLRVLDRKQPRHRHRSHPRHPKSTYQPGCLYQLGICIGEHSCIEVNTATWMPRRHCEHTGHGRCRRGHGGARTMSIFFTASPCVAIAFPCAFPASPLCLLRLSLCVFTASLCAFPASPFAFLRLSGVPEAVTVFLNRPCRRPRLEAATRGSCHLLQRPPANGTL